MARGPGAGPKLLTLVRRAIRLRHYSRHTEEAYVAWVRRFVRFAGLRHPASLGEAEVERFLSSLAELGVSATTQNQAASALRFLYEEVLGRPFARPAGVVHAKEPGRVPVVLTREEVRAVLGRMQGTTRLVALLLYGSGLRLLEALTLRVKDIDFGRGEIVVRRGKGARDRVTMLPQGVRRGSGSIWGESSGSTGRTSRGERVTWSSLEDSRASCPGQGGSGCGSGCSPRRACTGMRRPGSGGAIICARASCSGR